MKSLAVRSIGKLNGRADMPGLVLLSDKKINTVGYMLMRKNTQIGGIANHLKILNLQFEAFGLKLQASKRQKELTIQKKSHNITSKLKQFTHKNRQLAKNMANIRQLMLFYMKNNLYIYRHNQQVL